MKHSLSNASTHVSRETAAKLEVYGCLLEKWNRSINLVGRKTQADAWSRHFDDSLQLLSHMPPETRTAIDLGSGAGFPGLVLAIGSGVHFHLVEADRRKAAFLREVISATAAPADVHAARVERLELPVSPLVVARAFAPLSQLLPLAAPLLANDGMLLLLKGQRCEEELDTARRGWHMNVERHPSATDPRGIILRLTEIRRVGP